MSISKERLADAIAEHMYETGNTEVRPIIGGYVILAEFTDKNGLPSMTSIVSGLNTWTERGLLHQRLEQIVKEGR